MTSSGDEHARRHGHGHGLEIEEVADRIYRLPIAIPFEVGPVNCWLIRRDEPALVDQGPKTGEAWAALLAHFERLAFRPEDLRHLVVTHAHVDHHGNLARLAALAPGAAVHVHEDDAAAVFEHDARMASKVDDVVRMARLWGYPESALGATRRGYLSFGRFADPLPRGRWAPVRGEAALLALGATRARALHCPGHTEGHICLRLDEAGGLLLAGDHILERITPNPTVYLPPYRGRRTGLADYVASLEKVRGLEVATVLPGHGPAFGGFRVRVEAILAHHRERRARLAALIAERPRASTLDLVLVLWPGLDPAEHFLGCREVLGHLDLLIAEGFASEEVGADGVARFLPRSA